MFFYSLSQEGSVKIYVLLYEGVRVFDVMHLGSKYASDVLQHENIEVCLFDYMCVIVLGCSLTVQYYPFRLSPTEVIVHVR